MKTERVHKSRRENFYVNGKLLREGWVTVETFYSMTSYKLSRTGETIAYKKGVRRGHRQIIDGADINCFGSGIVVVPSMPQQ